MIIDRIILFLVLGFFCFIAEIDSWHEVDSGLSWHSTYLGWFLLIGLCLWDQQRRRDRPGS
jgi:hypothetical protein